jgi:hypothetical protein
LIGDLDARLGRVPQPDGQLSPYREEQKKNSTHNDPISSSHYSEG